MGYKRQGGEFDIDRYQQNSGLRGYSPLANVIHHSRPGADVNGRRKRTL